MAEAKRSKAETKRPLKRSTTVTKGTKSSKAKASVEQMPAVEAPVVEVPSAEVSPLAVPAEETPTVETPTAEGPVAVEVSAEEIRRAEKLLRSNGYLLIPYGKMGRGIARFFGAGVGLVCGACKGGCGWFSKKHAAMKVWREEKRRVAAEKKRLDDEAARCAEIAKTEKRLAELREEEARLKAAAATVDQPAPEPVVQSTIESDGPPVIAEPVTSPESEPIVQPLAETVKEPEVKEPEVAVPADSDVPKCIACGAELVSGARFCRKCGTRIAIQASSV